MARQKTSFYLRKKLNKRVNVLTLTKMGEPHRDGKGMESGDGVDDKSSILLEEKSKSDIPEQLSCSTRTSIGPRVLFMCI